MGAYLLSALFRNINSTIGPVLQEEFALDAATLGLMTSLFLFAVAGSQIFTGILLDRLGARRTVTMLLIIASIGALLFVRARPDIDHIPASQRRSGPVDAVRLLSCWPDIRLRAYFAGGTGNPFGTGGEPSQSLCYIGRIPDAVWRRRRCKSVGCD